MTGRLVHGPLEGRRGDSSAELLNEGLGRVEETKVERACSTNPGDLVDLALNGTRRTRGGVDRELGGGGGSEGEECKERLHCWKRRGGKDVKTRWV